MTTPSQAMYKINFFSKRLPAWEQLTEQKVVQLNPEAHTAVKMQQPSSVPRALHQVDMSVTESHTLYHFCQTIKLD